MCKTCPCVTHAHTSEMQNCHFDRLDVFLVLYHRAHDIVMFVLWVVSICVIVSVSFSSGHCRRH